MPKYASMHKFFFLLLWLPTNILALDYEAKEATPFDSTFNYPVYMAQPPDLPALYFVVEQAGIIKVVDASKKKTSVFLNIKSDVLSPENRGGSEEGLLGLAFDPDFKKSRTFYIYYSAPNPRRSIIARMKTTADFAAADIQSKQIIFEIAQPYSNHNGGMITFGPDKMFYIGLGDGGSRDDPNNRAQNPQDLLGKILRIDVRKNKNGYSIPPDNPFLKIKNVLPEIWVMGARNPWRFSFDRSTKELWVADVGQNLWEEINLVQAGDNLGWRVYEGSELYIKGNLGPGKIKHPVHEYGHNESGGYSITGGHVYRGNVLKNLIGHYIYADYASGNVWALKQEKGVKTQNTLIAKVNAVSSFAEDSLGELFLLSHQSGKILQLVPTKK